MNDKYHIVWTDLATGEFNDSIENEFVVSMIEGYAKIGRAQILQCKALNKTTWMTGSTVHSRRVTPREKDVIEWLEHVGLAKIVKEDEK